MPFFSHLRDSQSASPPAPAPNKIPIISKKENKINRTNKQTESIKQLFKKSECQ